MSIYEQCFGGGFVRKSTAPGRVAMSASSDQEISWASENMLFNEFLYRAITAFAGQTHLGEAVVSDSNGDGRVSAQEAFAFAVAADQAPENPLLESLVNSGDSSRIGPGF